MSNTLLNVPKRKYFTHFVSNYKPFEKKFCPLRPSLVQHSIWVLKQTPTVHAIRFIINT